MYHPEIKKKQDEINARKSFAEVLYETVAKDDYYRCDVSSQREDIDPSGSKEDIELTSRSYNYTELGGGALDVDLNIVDHCHSIHVVDLLIHLFQGSTPGLFYEVEKSHIHAQEMEVVLPLQ